MGGENAGTIHSRPQGRQTAEKEAAAKDLIRKTREARVPLIQRWAWSRPQWEAASPIPVAHGLATRWPEFMLLALFPPEAWVWTGEVVESGEGHGERWRQPGEMAGNTGARVGPMTTPAIWMPDTVSRKAENIAAAPYVVLDFDEFDGKKPETAEELRQHLRASLAIVRWLWKGMDWRLAAVLWTGSKSIHAWFHAPGLEAMESLKTAAEGLGIDKGLIGHPAHPCRLPCQVHAKTGKRSRLLWLDHGAAKLNLPG